MKCNTTVSQSTDLGHNWCGVGCWSEPCVQPGTTNSSLESYLSEGAVTPMKNQDSCGSCRTFSTTGSLESAWSIASGNLLPLSDQQLVACDGGFVDNGFAFGEKNGLWTGASHSYITTKGACKDSSCTVDIATVGERARMSAVGREPVSIAIERDQSSF